MYDSRVKHVRIGSLMQLSIEDMCDGMDGKACKRIRRGFLHKIMCLFIRRTLEALL